MPLVWGPEDRDPHFLLLSCRKVYVELHLGSSGPDLEATDLAEFLHLRANQPNKRRRLFWLIFAALAWTLGNTRNKIVIEHIFWRRASDMIFKFLAFLQHWHRLYRRRDREHLLHMTEALTSSGRDLASHPVVDTG